MGSSVIGKKIIKIRPLTKKELAFEGWEGREVKALVLEDDSLIYASGDEEGNYPGKLFGVVKGKTVMF